MDPSLRNRLSLKREHTGIPGGVREWCSGILEGVRIIVAGFFNAQPILEKWKVGLTHKPETCCNTFTFSVCRSI